ncbi:DUF2283 domain-containing protein [Empedobacter brevis]|uniref:DUF2283 domain-containing protein n=1 Tax=Empedobacter brevis TaxID=247 RepID=UPI0028A8C009|nr:DUF2283 domain-containing protein [Empedobacter brevis]
MKDIIKENEETIYIQLKEHPKKNIFGIVEKNIDIASLIKGYKGTPVYLDFNKDGFLIGIEILK